MAQHFLKARNWIFLSIAVTLALVTLSAEKVFKKSELKQQTLFTSTSVTALKTEILSRKDSLIVNLQGAENAAAVFNWIHLRTGPAGECYQDGLRAIGITDAGDIYVDTANSAAYAIVHRRCKDYYLLRLYKYPDEYRCLTDYIMTHDRFSSLRDSMLIRNGIVFYPFQFAQIPDDSVLIRRKSKGYEVLLPACLKDSIHYHFPEKNKLSGIYNRIAQKITAKTRRSFTPEDVHYIYNFFRRNSYFEDILFSNNEHERVGFLFGRVVGNIKCNSDSVRDLIIYIEGSRWINAKILCYNPVSGVILWQREIAPTTNPADFLITDIDGDRKEEIIFSSYSPHSAFDLNYYAFSDSFGMPSKSYFRIWNRDGTDKYINGKKCEWVNPEVFTKFCYTYIPEENSLLLGVYSYSYNPHFLMKLDIKSNTLDTLDIPTNSISFLKKYNDHILLINSKRNLDNGNITQSYVLNLQGEVLNRYERAFPFVFSPNSRGMIFLFGGNYISANDGLYNEKLERVLGLQPKTSVIGAFGNTLILNASDPSLPTGQNYIYQALVYESYTFERWFLYLLAAELFVLFFYYFIRYLVFQPINTGSNSYFELYSVFGKMYFWMLQGNMGKIYTIPNRLSYSKETFMKLLNDLGGKTEPFIRRRFLGTRYEVYEIPSKDEWIIIQRIAHDIKNRMMSLGINLEFIENLSARFQDKKDCSSFESLKKDILELSDIAGKLSQFSHLERLNKETVELTGHLRKIIDRRLNHPKFGNIRFVPFASDVTVDLDKKLFEMAFDNLLDNALDVIQENEHVDVFISVDEYNAIIRISNPSVMDTTVMDKISDIGFSTKKNGSGLGIPIAKQIIEKQGGVMDVQYNDGVFSVTIQFKRTNL